MVLISYPEPSIMELDKSETTGIILKLISLQDGSLSSMKTCPEESIDRCHDMSVLVVELPETSNISPEESVMEDTWCPEVSYTLVMICPEESNMDNTCPEESNTAGIGCPEASNRWGRDCEGIGELGRLVWSLDGDIYIYIS
jgi:hypothetical protein